MKTITRSSVVERLADGYVALSTETPCDQDGYVLKAEGWDLSRFEKVPMKMAYNHDVYSFPIGRWEGLKVVGKKLVAKPVFAADEDPARAGVAQRLWDSGFLDDTSISFRVDSKQCKPVKIKGRDYVESYSHAPHEASIVFSGADPNAGKGRMDEAVQRGIVTREEADSFENAKHEGDYATRDALDALRAEVVRLREQIEQAASPAAPAPETARENENSEPGITRERIEQIIADAVAKLTR